MPGYSIEREFGRNRIDERLTAHFPEPRAHRAPHQGYQMPENSTAYLDFNEYKVPQYTFHVHQTGLSLKTAQGLIDEAKPRYQVLAVHCCDQTIDAEGNPGSFIILQRQDQ